MWGSRKPGAGGGGGGGVGNPRGLREHAAGPWSLGPGSGLTSPGPGPGSTLTAPGKAALTSLILPYRRLVYTIYRDGALRL